MCVNAHLFGHCLVVNVPILKVERFRVVGLVELSGLLCCLELLEVSLVLNVSGYNTALKGMALMERCEYSQRLIQTSVPALETAQTIVKNNILAGHLFGIHNLGCYD